MRSLVKNRLVGVQSIKNLQTYEEDPNGLFLFLLIKTFKNLNHTVSFHLLQGFFKIEFH